MAVRESIDRHKPWAVGGACVALAVAAVFGMMNRTQPDERLSGMAWFTTDDGRTWFKDSDRRVPPFDRGGRPAVLAHVYHCGGGPFVAWMQRYDPDGKEILDAYRAAEDAGRPPSPTSLIETQNHVEFKRPGEKQWTPASDGQAVMAMIEVACPDGGGGGPSGRDAYVVWP